MSNKVKDIVIKSCTYYFFNEINIKNFDPNNTKIVEKSYKINFTSSIGYVTIKNLEYVKINGANPLCPIFSKMNRYFEEINGNKYLTLVPTNESEENVKKYEELWNKIIHLIRSITENSDDYDGQYMKIKLSSDDELLDRNSWHDNSC